MEKKLYIILSNQPYDIPNKTNKHYVAEELVKRGNYVIFVDPPTRFKFLKSLIKKRKLELVSKKADNFYVYYPVNTFNFYPFSNLFNRLHAWFILRISQNIPTSNIPQQVGAQKLSIVLWVYHFDFPKIFQLKKLIKPDIFLYDCVDSYKDFPEYSWEDITNKGVVSLIQKFDRYFKIKLDQKGLRGKEWVEYREEKLAKQSDLMFVSHPALFDRFIKLNKNTYYTPNAGRFDVFSKKPNVVPKVLSDIKHPNVLYAGALDNYKFDVDTFVYLAKNTPNINYALIGPLKLSDSSNKVEELKSLKNVVLAGMVEKADIYSHVFDAYIIPYRTSEYVLNGCFPIKLFNALSSGCPTVVSDLPCYREYKSVLYIAKSKEEWVSMLKQAVAEKDIKKRNERIKMASVNTWENKVDTQTNAIHKALVIKNNGGDSNVKI